MATVDFICQKLAYWFDEPCNYGLGNIDIDDYMTDNGGDWCETHCDNHESAECWEQFFRLQAKEQKTDDKLLEEAGFEL